MASLPHDPTSASLGNIVIETLRRLDFRNDRTAWLHRQDVTRVDDQQTVTPQHLALLINRSDSVRIPVIPDSHISPMILHRLHEVGEVLKNRRVRMMIGKTSVQIAIEPRHLTPQQLKRLFGNKGSRAVPAIDHDMQPVRVDMREAFLEVRQIVGNNRMLGETAVPRYKHPCFHHPSKFLNVLSMNG